jgi:hypothetical protein
MGFELARARRGRRDIGELGNAPDIGRSILGVLGDGSKTGVDWTRFNLRCWGWHVVSTLLGGSIVDGKNRV